MNLGKYIPGKGPEVAMSIVGSKTNKEASEARANSQEAASQRSFHGATEAKSCLISLEKDFGFYSKCYILRVI